MARRTRLPFTLRLYRALTRAGAPLASALLKYRLKKGKEDPQRLGERRGVASAARPAGPLVWVHVASVGEFLSIQPLLERMAKSVRRVFHAQAVWAESAEISRLYDENLAQHRAIREALAAGSPGGARVLVSEHVIQSGRLLEAILDRLEEKGAAPGS